MKQQITADLFSPQGFRGSEMMGKRVNIIFWVLNPNPKE
jgi:hypothetical protein